MPEYIEKSRPGTAVKERTKKKAKVEKPRRYKVLLHNDDYTTMEFVVEVLVSVFNKSADEAVRIMLAVHHQGVGLAGIYAKAIAEAKVDTVHSCAREQGYPLRCSTEPE